MARRRPGALVVVTGTGTGIGKTHFSEALLLSCRQRLTDVAGFKPVETGYSDEATSDAGRLARSSSFHVKQPGQRYAAPISPHLAARQTGDPIRFDDLVEQVARVRDDADFVLVELPGGLFSPLSDTHLNADFARALRPDSLILAAPDRLGVLHDAIAATRAARAVSLTIDALVLIAPGMPDSSTGLNASELVTLTDIPTVAQIPRQTVQELAASADLCAFRDALFVSLGLG